MFILFTFCLPFVFSLFGSRWRQSYCLKLRSCEFFLGFSMKNGTPKMVSQKWYPKNESKYEYFKILQFLHLTSLRLHRQKIVLTRKYIGKLPLVWGKNPTTIEDKWFNLKKEKHWKKCQIKPTAIKIEHLEKWADISGT